VPGIGVHRTSRDVPSPHAEVRASAVAEAIFLLRVRDVQLAPPRDAATAYFGPMISKIGSR